MYDSAVMFLVVADSYLCSAVISSWCCNRSLGVFRFALQLSVLGVVTDVSPRFFQQGLCQKEKPLDNSLYSDGIGTDIDAHLLPLPRTLS